jgi:hypothetical protein
MKKRYTLSYDWSYDVVVEIDDEKCTDALLHEINNFWSDADWRLSEADGDVRQAVLKMLATSVLRATVSEWNALDEFKVKGVEGWPLLDGSCGILLVSADDFEFDAEEISIKEQA